MSEQEVRSRFASTHWMLAGIFTALLVLVGIVRWDESPFAAMAVILFAAMISVFLAGFLFGRLAETGIFTGLAPLGWISMLWISLSVFGLLIGVVGLVEGSNSLAGLAWVFIALVGMFAWIRQTWIVAFLRVGVLRISLMLWAVLLVALGLVGLIRGDEILASLALIFLPVMSVLLGALLFGSIRGAVFDAPQLDVPTIIWALMLGPIIAVVVGILTFGLDRASIDRAADDPGANNDVAQPVIVPAEESDDSGSPEDGADDVGGSGGVEGAGDGPEVSVAEEGQDGTSENSDSEANPNQTPPDEVVRPTISPVWDPHSELLGGATFDVPPITLSASPILFRSGPNALSDPSDLRFDSVILGQVELTAELIAALPGRFGSGAPGLYTVIGVTPTGEPNTDVAGQHGVFIARHSTATTPIDGQVGFGASVLDVLVRAFLDVVNGTVVVVDPDFARIDRDIFFTSSGGYETVFVGHSVLPEGGYAWLTRFGRMNPPTEDSPAGMTAAGPFPIGGSEFLGGFEVSSEDPALNCENLGDFAYCYDSTEIRHIFRFGGCFAGADPDSGITLYPTGGDDSELPEIIVTEVASGNQIQIDASSWISRPSIVLEEEQEAAIVSSCLD